MPSSLTSVAGLVQPQEGNKWIVRMGDDVPKFLYANGPARIHCYNFGVVWERVCSDLVHRRRTLDHDDYSDIFELTTAGSEANGSRLGWTVELACTGTSLYGKQPPNCQRMCCGGSGFCLSDCTGSVRYSSCSVRILIKATLDDVRHGQVTIELKGRHVPPGVEPIPPPKDGLKPAPFALRKLREECASDYPTRVANKAVAKLGEGVERNTRLAPPGPVLAGCKKRDARTARGGSMDDATRIDMLVRCHLIQRGMVLLYIPGMQLVLTTPWALEQARLALMISVDAKIDSVTGARSKWTSVGGKFHP